MKRTLVLWLFGILLLPFTGCQKDNIVLVDMITTSDDENDDIANTTFAQTVYVTFSSKGNAAVTGTNDDFHVTTNGNGVFRGGLVNVTVTGSNFGASGGGGGFMKTPASAAAPKCRFRPIPVVVVAAAAVLAVVDMDRFNMGCGPACPPV